jgi:hypothetical protein
MLVLLGAVDLELAEAMSNIRTELRVVNSIMVVLNARLANPRDVYGVRSDRFFRCQGAWSPVLHYPSKRAQSASMISYFSGIGRLEGRGSPVCRMPQNAG